ncbi:unannotated protein [freshwater metagenome]|uniref:Unannotated protein n=1 Tax=freshwater metagenome TaxID=449393 RepID=A0A6J6M4V5_9ZZZZ
MILNEKTFLPNLFKRPPHTFDVFRGHGPVGLIKIDPEAHSIGHIAKSGDVALNRFAALIVESGNSKFFDIALTVKSQLFLNCNFNWKPMAIPPGFTRYKATLHCLKAREDIFKNSRLNMMRSRHSIGSRRTLVKAPWSCACASINGLMKNLVIAPELENFMFEGR